ncbi:AMP-binding enzyme C-terminal domain-containing protein [Amycolatopsis xylanica]|uniref:AMP-binding enzyme C-terminal domain-containing protein n=1 Tax=Amycolatopsis xylanica TaxID=589385 RepID=A0A1H3SDS4_9PSEU|nr:phosphopantetheine-binding protein [Amycolatopsis xylanica]SDZ35755.1 AMP-binding enzyme C-terminal domain-containing protein [Amycolatopsis xylanica]
MDTTDAVSPGEVESALTHHHAVTGSAVFALTHQALGEATVAAVTVRYDVGVRELHQHLRQQLPVRDSPALILVLPELPKNARDVVDLLDRPGPARFVAPRSAPERALAGIWSEVLEVGAVGVDVNFFELGGESLAAIEIAARAKSSLGVELDVADIFDRPTVAEQAELLGGTSDR